MMKPAAVQSKSDVSPAGYCPHCDYQILGPGVCSECGKDVSAERIRSLPRRKRRIRWVKRITVATLLVALVVGGRLIYESKIYWRLFPNSMVIDAYPSNLTAVAEVRRRLTVGRFGDDDVFALIDKSIVVSFDIESPRARDIPIQFTLNLQTANNSAFIFVEDQYGDYVSLEELLLDGQPVNNSMGYSEITSNSTAGFTNQYISLNYSLESNTEPGRYQLLARPMFHVAPIVNRPSAAYSSLLETALERSFEKTVEILDQSVIELHNWQLSSEEVSQIRENVSLGVCRLQDNTFAFDVCTKTRGENYFFNANLAVLKSEELVDHLSSNMFIDGNFPRASRRTLIWRGTTDSNTIFKFTAVYNVAKSMEAGLKTIPFVVEWLSIDADTVRTRPWTISRCQYCETSFVIPPDVVRPVTEQDLNNLK